MSSFLRDAIEETKAIARSIAETQRAPEAEQNILIFQQYDGMLSSDSVQAVAEAALTYRDQISVLDEQQCAVNVLDSSYLIQREEQNRKLRRAAAGNNSAGAAAAAAATHFTSSTSFGAGAEKNEMEEIVQELYQLDILMEHSWGIVLLVAMRMQPAEEEHHEEIISDFENLFGRPSSYLRALLIHSTSILDTLSLYQLHFASTPVDVVVAALHKNLPKSSEELQEVLQFMEGNQIPVTVAVAELLEKAFVRCMKAEGAEFVYRRMVLECRLPPMTTRSFAMLFNAKVLEKEPSVIEYYEYMLDYGIKPELSSLRLLCNKCKKEHEYALNHFTQLSKAEVLESEPASPAPAAAAAAAPPQQDSLRRNPLMFFVTRLQMLAKDAETTTTASVVVPPTPSTSSTTAGILASAGGSGSTAGTHAGLGSTTATAAMSSSTTPPPHRPVHLLEAMKVLHRIDVEGRSVRNDLMIVENLLLLFCHGTTPLEDLVLPFQHSKAISHPHKVELPPATAEGQTGRRHLEEEEEEEEEEQHRRLAEWEKKHNGGFVQKNAFDFNLTDDVGEFLEPNAAAGPNEHQHGDSDSSVEGGSLFGGEEDRGLSTGGAAAGGGAASMNPGARGDAAAAGGRRRPHGPPPGIASVSQEAEYVLKVMEEMFDWHPDDRLLRNIHKTLSIKYQPRVLEILEVIIFDQFKRCREMKGETGALTCCATIELAQHYILHHQKPRVSDLLMEMAQQFYEFNEIYKRPWEAPSFETYPLWVDNDRAARNLITIAVRVGRNVDWCLGLFTLGMLISDSPTGNQLKRRIQSFNNDAPHHAPHVRVIEEIQRCEWDKEQIFQSRLLMHGIVENHQSTPTSGNEALGAGGSLGAGAGAEGDLEAEYMGGSDPYSRSGRGGGVEERRTLEDYLNIALRDIKLSRAAVDWYRRRLMSLAVPK